MDIGLNGEGYTMNKNQLHQLVDEYAELNLSLDARTAARLCVVLMHLQKVGHTVLAEHLASQEYDNAHAYIDKIEGQ